jgi:hypothetical protein
VEPSIIQQDAAEADPARRAGIIRIARPPVNRFDEAWRNVFSLRFASARAKHAPLQRFLSSRRTP